MALGKNPLLATMARITGTYDRKTVGGEEFAAFIPRTLPPADPPLQLDAQTRERLRAAEHAMSRLELAGEMVPSVEWFIYAFVRKEAVISSQIEGTQATLVDLLTYEAGAQTEPAAEVEVQEVCNYVEALAFARKQLSRKNGLPLSVRLLNETHHRLMKGVRGAEKQPGEIRSSQNWIGGTRPGNAVYVPPPPYEVPRLLGELEQYLHAEDALPPLVRAGLAHVQFETVHPYLDGNGRLGRLLVTLLLGVEAALPATPLPEPVLQEAPGRLLPDPESRSDRRGLGRVDCVLPRGRRNHRRGGGPERPRPVCLGQPRPRTGSRWREGDRRCLAPLRGAAAPSGRDHHRRGETPRDDQANRRESHRAPRESRGPRRDDRPATRPDV